MPIPAYGTCVCTLTYIPSLPFPSPFYTNGCILKKLFHLMLFQKQVIMETYQTYTKVDRRVTQILMYPSVNFSKRLFSANLVYSLSPPTSQPPHPAPECFEAYIKHYIILTINSSGCLSKR